MSRKKIWGPPDIDGDLPTYSGSPFSQPVRFEPMLEQRYLESIEPVGRAWRLVVTTAILIYSLVMLALCFWVLGSPPEITAYTRPLIASLIPAAAFSVLCAAWRRLHAWSITACIVSTLVAVGVISVTRMLYAKTDHNIVPLYLLPAVLLALIISHIPFSRLIPTVLFGLAFCLGLELWTFGLNVLSLQDAVIVSVVVLVGVVLIYDFDQLLRINWYRQQYLDQVACTDPLTRLGNRRHFEDTLRTSIRSAQRDGRQLALLILDIDHFKSYNDHFGHLEGDQCLRTIAACLRKSGRRPGDNVARMGGEEFCVLWFDVNLDDAARMGRDLLAGIAALGIKPAPNTGASVTASAGLAHWSASSAEKQYSVEWNADDLILRADQSLYTAKREGRNRLVVSQM